MILINIFSEHQAASMHLLIFFFPSPDNLFSLKLCHEKSQTQWRQTHVHDLSREWAAAAVAVNRCLMHVRWCSKYQSSSFQNFLIQFSSLSPLLCVSILLLNELWNILQNRCSHHHRQLLPRQYSYEMSFAFYRCWFHFNRLSHFKKK